MTGNKANTLEFHFWYLFVTSLPLQWLSNKVSRDTLYNLQAEKKGEKKLKSIPGNIIWYQSSLGLGLCECYLKQGSNKKRETKESFN